MINDGDGQDDPRDPVVFDPGKPNTNFRKEGGHKKREHGECHDQVEESRAQRVPGHTLRNLDANPRGSRRRARMRSGGFRPVPYINGMRDQEQQTPDCGHPQKIPANVDRDLLTPRICRPLDEVQAASPPATPRIARFTRFLMSGTLYPLYCKGWAPRTASCPAISAVSAFLGFPCTAASTAVSRTG